VTTNSSRATAKPQGVENKSVSPI